MKQNLTNDPSCSLFSRKCQTYIRLLKYILFSFLLFICSWLCWIFIAVWAFLQLWVTGISLQWLLSLQSKDSRAHGLQQLWPPSSRGQAQQLWHMGLVALEHVGSSQILIEPCIGLLQRLLHWQVDSLPMSHQGIPHSIF